MSVDEIKINQLTGGGKCLVDACAQIPSQYGQEKMGVYHWLLGLLDRHELMAVGMVPDLAPKALHDQIINKLNGGSIGDSLTVEEVITASTERAKNRNQNQASERDICAVILLAAGYDITNEIDDIRLTTKDDCQEISPYSSSYQPRCKRPTPVLDKFGLDLTRSAAEGNYRHVIGRDEEICLVIETLCRRIKRNPVLVGPAGVGKTAIVEGLAHKMIEGAVPDQLKNSRIIAIQPSILVAGSRFSGEIEERIKSLLAEAQQEGIFLFIDEVHSIVGTGGMPGTNDIASLLKPELARGQIACIAATTDEEYRRFIEQDSALERRFQPVRVHELTAEQSLSVLEVLRDSLRDSEMPDISDDILRWLVDFAGRNLPNRYFPDKAVDLFEQVIAYGSSLGKVSIDIADAETVSQRMIGMPQNPATALD